MSRHYDHNGLKLPSVTTIISDATDKSGPLTQWSANMTSFYVNEWLNDEVERHRRNHYREKKTVLIKDVRDLLEEARFNFRNVSKEALDVGSTVHAAIELWLKSGKEPANADGQVLAGFIAFLEFFDEHKMETIETEHTVFGSCWAGTLDWYGRLDGKLTVLDVKTSKGFYDGYGEQIAAYRSCMPDCEASGVLRLDKETGLPEYKDYSNRYYKDLRVFEKMVELYMERHPRIAKNAGWEG